ncbi:MAG: alkaline-phosphatase-like protein, partial [Benjaminiella poitrasii]
MKLWCSSRSRIGPVLVLLTIIQLFSLAIFLKGFLLTRQTLNDLTGHVYPAWDRFPLHHSTPSSISPPSIPSRPPFKRTILILIDALRFDFVLPNTTSDAFFLNQFPIMHQLRQSHPELSLLFQFRADPPTTTMQRIKGLMTGSLPTFIDAGANFASSAVAEDHLLRHIAHRYRNRYFMGDDTWVHLFPESFVDHQTWPLDSFKMLDLDSVDDAIEARLWPLLSEKTDWEFLIAHFLGVDHCGHTYGPSDPNMSRKLQQMNTVIERLAEYVDDDTLLVVMGDHGMSVEGDHGGESIEELTSTLFLHSGRQLTDRKNEAFYKRLHDERAHLLGYDLAEVTRRLRYDGTIYPMVAQIHLVPTLSYLLQVPIPSGNLGALIPEVVYPMEHYEKDDRLWHMVEQFRLNALQVHDYLGQYAKHTHHLDFSEEKLRPMRAHLYEAEEIVYQSIQQHQQQKNTTQQLEEAILAYDRFLISTIKYC